MPLGQQGKVRDVVQSDLALGTAGCFAAMLATSGLTWDRSYSIRFPIAGGANRGELKLSSGFGPAMSLRMCGSLRPQRLLAQPARDVHSSSGDVWKPRKFL
jgi:hypothetical protein